MPALPFKTWFEANDIFGFDKEEEARRQKEILSLKNDDEKPIRRFDLFSMMHELATYEFNLQRPRSRFFNELTWGEHAGAMRVSVSPKFNVRVQKLHYGRDGTPLWCCHKLVVINTDKYAGKEGVVAKDIYELVEMVGKKPLEKNVPPNLEELALKIAVKMRSPNNDLFQFANMRKVNESDYAILFNLRGGGQGRSIGAKSTRAVNCYVLHICYQEAVGAYKVFLAPVATMDETGSWEQQPSDFSELFMPSQDRSEIIEVITNTLKWF